MLSTRNGREAFRDEMGVEGTHVLVLAARQPEFVALLRDAGYEVEARTRPLDDGEVAADLVVVFRGRLLGRNQAALVHRRGVPVIEVMTVDPPSPSSAGWVRISNRVPKSDLVQVVHAVADWARNRVGAHPLPA